MTGVRGVKATELPAVARLWHGAWHDAHSAIVPPELVRFRSLKIFTERAVQLGDRVRIVGPVGAPQGMCAIDGAELDQLFLAPQARGSGVADDLLADGERRIARAGHPVGHLYCAVGNVRAIKFYTRHGWSQREVRAVAVELGERRTFLDALIMEKTLARA